MVTVKEQKVREGRNTEGSFEALGTPRKAP